MNGPLGAPPFAQSPCPPEPEGLHRPVMAREAVELLGVRPGGRYVDATLGTGGHALEILRASGPDGLVVGLDWDEEALRIARERLRPFGERVILRRANFADLPQVLEELGLGEVDGVLFDLGVSSLQLERPERGFSFQLEGPLDMRMDRRLPLRAADLVNRWPLARLERLLRELGGERWARRIARAIVRRRAVRPFESTRDLAETVRMAVPRCGHRLHPATRTFQALRIAVNDELGNLRRALEGLPRALRPGGRACVISFHSLEDRLVKQAFRAGELQAITPKPLRPSPEEVRRNPRARSARMRAAQRR